MVRGSYWSKRVTETMEGRTEHENGKKVVGSIDGSGDFYSSTTDLG